MRRTPTLRVLVVFVTLGLSLSACTSSPTETTQAPASTAQAVPEATAEVGSIESVIVLDAVISSEVSYQVTAPIAGSVFVSKKNVFSIRNESQQLDIVPIEGATFDAYRTRTDGVFAAPVGLPLIDATYRGFVVTAEVARENVLRIEAPPIGARAQIKGGAEPFDCALLDPYPSSSTPITADSVFKYSCLVPPEQRVIVGMTGRLAIVLENHADVVTLPIEAVAGTVDSGEVSLKTSEGVEKRKVILGISDGIRVEIVDGLVAGDVVVLPNPGMLPNVSQ